MRRFASIITVSLSLLGLALGGCDGESPNPDGGAGGVDSGTPRDAGGRTDSGMPTTDSGTPTTDAGTPMTDAGPPSCLDGRIRILETCPAFTPCGGDVVGSWCYADFCVTEDEILDRVFASGTPGITAECQAARDEIVVRRSTGSASGTVDIDGTTLTRVLTTTATGSFFIPEVCVIVNCNVTGAAINGILEMNGAGSAVCRDEPDSDACECDITFFSTVDEDVGYTLDGNTIVTSGGRRFDYCVDASGLRFREDPADATEPGIQLVLETTP